MSFNASLVASGLQTSQVLSDEKHFSSFLCQVCDDLISLDSVVTTSCNHPFCRKCLEQTAMEAFVSQSDCVCPACQTDLTQHDASTPCMQVGSLQVAARPLAQAQPLAYRVLGCVHVACVHGPCGWSGDYSDYLKHVMSHNGTTSSKKVSKKSLAKSHSSQRSDGSTDSFELKGDSSQRRKSKAQVQSETPSTQDGTERSDDERRNRGAYPASSLVSGDRSASSRGGGFNKGNQFNDMNASISSNMGFWDYDDHDQSDASMLESPVKIPNRTLGNSNLEFARSFPEDESVSQFDESFGDLQKQDEIDHLKRLVVKAEKYKKQANARFNKNEFTSARSLYSKGIKLLCNVELETESQRDLLAHMYSNRAVAYFRNKQFDECILDCDMAIQHRPTNEKSWIRKWRALKAKGEFDEAYTFIANASKSLPSSDRIHKDYKHCRKEKELLSKVQGFMNKGDVVSARSTLESEVGPDCDNIVLFVYSARLSITVGALEDALEKINKALRFNPDYVDALESRGFLYFFQGDMEKAWTFLYDAHVRHKSHENLKAATERVKHTKELYEEANDLVEREEFKQSVDVFTQAIDASSPMPPLAPMYAIMRTHRAESYMAMKQYVAALKDCQEVLKFQSRFAPAWVVRAQVMCALGQAEKARKEIVAARKSWGAGDPDIEKGYKYVEFELRVSKEDCDMEAFKSELDAGDRSRIMTRGGSVRRLGSRQTQQLSTTDPNPQAQYNSSQNVLSAQPSDSNLLSKKKKDRISSFGYSMSDLSDFCAGDLGQDESSRRRKPIDEQPSSRSCESGNGERRRRRASAFDSRRSCEQPDKKQGRTSRRSSTTSSKLLEQL